MTAEEVAVAYQPGLHVADEDWYLEEYARLGQAARHAYEHRRISYGPHPDEWLWYVPAPEPGAPLFVFVHGGYWRGLSADDGCLLAPEAHAAGAAFASVNYTLCPAAPLDVLVEQARRAVSHLVTEASDLGHDASRVHVAGHSAGAHLAAMVAIADPRPAGYVLVSGIYDVVPIVHTPINDDVGLSLDDAVRLSPLTHVGEQHTAAMLVAVGADETAEFHRQSRAWASRWASGLPGRQPTVIDVAGRNHYDVIFDLLEPATALGRAVLAQLAHPA